MNNEREKFSQRLAQAMQDAGYEPRPVVLFRLFNSKYRGRSVSFQTTSRWLGGMGIPAQDKLLVIAQLLGVEPHALRFGSTGKGRVAESRPAWPAMSGKDRQTIDALLKLPPKRRALVAELVEALSESD
ncbi:hypothetical protein [Pseudoxanthomonas dokdonensis]|uniref:DNA-binding protein n=1 Tax=Pseudoxanthomonas dokdonensis TaxID=344882 RepID=A0A0R0CW65_9GAMM|nr:hypothetical protein [Pseudoxanthomonas dokdonensis]KRG70017.1 hypothetical protein ABB29_07175 [Pseudoxanthomonas dokdonensis]